MLSKRNRLWVECKICSKQMRKDNLKNQHIRGCIRLNKLKLLKSEEVLNEIREWITSSVSSDFNLDEYLEELSSTSENLSLRVREKIQIRNQLEQELKDISSIEVKRFIQSPKSTAETILSSKNQLQISKKYFFEIAKAGGLTEHQKKMMASIKESVIEYNTRECLVFLNPEGGAGKTYLSHYLRAITVLECSDETFKKEKVFFLFLTSTSLSHQASVIEEVKDITTKEGLDVKIVVLLNLPKKYTKFDILNLEEMSEGVWRHSYKSAVYKTFPVKIIIFCNEHKIIKQSLSDDRVNVIQVYTGNKSNTLKKYSDIVY